MRAEAHQAFPFIDLSHQYAALHDELTRSIAAVLESRRFILGPEVDAFERDIAAWNGSRAAIACASGSDALLLALMALEIGPGDEVIAPPFTFVATVSSIVRLGATPVFADIDPATFNIDAKKVQYALSPRTRAIIPVHMFGCSADLDPILAVADSRSITVIEDAAQAIGAKYRGRRVGSIARIGCFSFYPTKNIGCAGDGGLLTTEDDEIAERLRVLHTHGSRSRYSYDLVGVNSRLDALQAAILRVKLPHLDNWIDARRGNAERYWALFLKYKLETHVGLPTTPAFAYHVYNQFTIRVQHRDRLRAHLDARGIPSEVYYPYPLHLQPAFLYLGNKPGSYPEAERASLEVLSLPIYPGLTFEQQKRVVEAIAQFYAA